MAKILIHVGFPKTATTTLQKVIFNKLHENGAINYLGRNSNSLNENISKKIRESWLGIQNNKINLEKYLRDDKLNVYSDEEFLFPEYYLQKKYKSKVNINIFKYLNRCFLGHEIEFVFVIRNQPEILYSQYVQFYRFFIDSKTDNTIDSHFFNESRYNSSKFKNQDYNCFFNDVKKIVQPNKIHIIPYESLLLRNIEFIDFWINVLNIKTNSHKEIIKEGFKSNNINSKKKSNLGTSTNTKPLINASGILLSSLRNKMPGIYELLKSIFLIFFKNKNSIIVRKFKDNEKHEIIKFYENSNRLFFKSFSINTSYLKYYISND